MTTTLSAAQLRGAQAMLDWSLVDLARSARLSVAAVKRVRDGVPGQPAASIGAVRDALEAEGVSFLADDGTGPGIRLRRC